MVQIDLLFATQNPGVQVGGQAMEINKNDCIVNLSYKYSVINKIATSLHCNWGVIALQYNHVLPHMTLQYTLYYI